MNDEERANWRHILLHLESNRIADPAVQGGWYCGDRAAFIARHEKALAFARGMAQGNVAEAFRRAVNAACTCGGGEPGRCCPACAVWHALDGGETKAKGNTK
jgi:hypothetical protein